jgi:hypothetical protein
MNNILSILVQEIISHILIHCFNPDDHDMKPRLDAFRYDAAEFSYDGIRYDAMITIKF